MRLESVLVGNFRTLKGVEIPLEGLGVLFGQNNAGKTNILEAVRHINHLAGARTDDGQFDRSIGPVLRLDRLQDSKSPDAKLLSLALWNAPGGTEELAREPGGRLLPYTRKLTGSAGGELRASSLTPMMWQIRGGPGPTDLNAALNRTPLPNLDRDNLGAGLEEFKGIWCDPVGAAHREIAGRLFDLVFSEPLVAVESISCRKEVERWPLIPWRPGRVVDVETLGVHVGLRRDHHSDAVVRELLESDFPTALDPENAATTESIVIRIMGAERGAFVPVLFLGAFDARLGKRVSNLTDLEAWSGSLIPPVLTAEQDDIDELERQVEQTLVGLHDRVWRVGDEAENCLSYCIEIPDSVMVFYRDYPDQEGQKWFEKVVAHSQEGSEPCREDCRLRPTIPPILRLIAEEANRVAPDFVKRQGEIRLTLRSPENWHGKGTRISIDFAEAATSGECEARGVAHLGAGIRRWVQVSVGEACRNLGVAEVEWDREMVREAWDRCAAERWKDAWNPNDWPPVSMTFDQQPREFEDLDLTPEQRRQWENWWVDRVTARDFCPGMEIWYWEACEAGTLPKHVRFRPGTSGGALLVDEPESGLHPAAQSEVARWCIERSRDRVAVLVATHSPEFLDLAPEDGELYRVAREGDRTALAPLDAALREGLDEAARDLGLSRAGILQLTRGFLIVEGEHDRCVLEHFFGGELRRERFWTLPLRGTKRMAGLMESEWLSRLGLPIAVLLDNTRPSTLEAMLRGDDLPRDATQEERAHHELHRWESVRAAHIAFDEPDIICALPPAAVARAFGRDFQSWGPIIDGWREKIASGKSVGFKDYALKRLGVDKVTADDFLDVVLSSVKPEDKPAASLRAAVNAALAALTSAADVSALGAV